MKKLHIAALAVIAMVAAAGCQSQGAAGKASGNFKGETINLVVPFDPGGGYDSYARQLAPALGKELGAKVVVVNKPGAGGLLAMNELSSAKPDGTTLEILNMTGAVGSALAGADGVKYKPQDFSYVGQIASEPDVVIAAKKGAIKSSADLVAAAQKGGLRFAATGPGSNEYVDPLVLSKALGVNNKIVTGFAGSGEAALALLQGHVDAYSRSLGSQLPTIKSGDGIPILVLGSKPVAQFPDVPTMLDVAGDAASKEMLQFHAHLLESGRTIAAPPKMDQARLAELRDAFAKVVQEADFVAEGEKAGRPIVYKSGADVAKTVDELMNPPAAYVDILKAAYQG
ncbi:tripartite tricarboxylate transporter substrate binding protein [Micromonospora sp. NPDC023966]|uniref:Bug family tripartite tricarboxylate transporter substrate binding protein n=1 Tax=Micromonospora sp. NPDC023966 TaxID=3154699 RepID=UPI0033DDD69F